MTKITADTLKLISKLPDARRRQVDAVVRRHVKACHANGFEPENLNRVYIEAIEVVQLEEQMPELYADTFAPSRHVVDYVQYRTPKNPWIN